MSSPMSVERILSPSSEDTPMAPTPTQKPKGGSGPRRASPGDVELSVFDIHNIFRRRWFLSRTNLLTNVISAQKDEDGNISWVEFTPQYHSHLVKCAVALVPHPVLKVKKVIFSIGKVIWPSSNSRRVAARPIMPKRRRGVLHGNGAKQLSEKGNGPEKAAVGPVSHTTPPALLDKPAAPIAPPAPTPPTHSTAIPTVTGDLWDTNPSGPWFFHHHRTGKRMGVRTRKDAEELLASGEWIPA
ncbi:hypothetical protein BC826DRAFT_1119697 [Russula brevipes]|nr:hypothetical protein BC826DRAFT_1119697 [Russula brevipes]